VRYTHQQLAEIIGSYCETVTKAMGEFRDTHLIRIDEDVIQLIDMEGLRQLANR
jgi:CRP-like cAMP-binding protein